MKTVSKKPKTILDSDNKFPEIKKSPEQAIVISVAPLVASTEKKRYGDCLVILQ
jgi:hypothetical protein